MALLALTGCSASREAANPEKSPSPRPSYSLPAEPPAAQRYRSLDEMARVIERTGAELTVEVLGPGNNEDTLKDFAIMSTPDMRLNVYLFESLRFRDMWLPQMEAQGEVVYGPNWIVYTLGTTEFVHSVFGGEISGP